MPNSFSAKFVAFIQTPKMNHQKNGWNQRISKLNVKNEEEVNG